MRKQILAEIEATRQKYINNAIEIVKDYYEETEFSRNYEGRQILELLQNADDEATDSSGKVKILFKDNTLTVSNTGTPFSFDGIQSLMHPFISSKKHHANKIGCKGLGFRSVLTWATCVTIASRFFTVQFSKDYAIDFLNSILAERPEHIETIRKEKVASPIATLACPKLLDDFAPEKGFATTIIINCKDSVEEKIESQLRSLEFEELVFLPNLKEIEIECGGYHKTFYKVSEQDDVIIETIDHITGEEDCASWHLYKTSGKIDIGNETQRDYEFIVAYDSSGEHTGEVLYSYFKTDVKMEFPALIHGTFELTSDRNSLIKESTVNQQLVDLLSDFLVKTAVDISKGQEKCNYDPLRLIISANMDIVLSKNYHLDTLLKTKAREKAILPTISGEYISISDDPRYSIERFDTVLNPSSFNELLISAEDEDYIQRYIRCDLGLHFYEYEDFCERLNSDIDHYSTVQKTRLIGLIDSEYCASKSDEVFPHLLEDSTGKSITDQSIVYPLPDEEQVISLPDWAEIKFLSPEMEKQMYAVLDLNNKNRRQLEKILYRYHYDEYSFDRLLRGLDCQINSVKKCKDILAWLWHYYETEDDHSINYDFKVKVPCRDGEIRYSNECYIGKEYGNELGERLISLYSNNSISPSCLYNVAASPSEISRFFEWLGVSKYPRFEKKTLSADEHRREYLRHCGKMYVKQDNCYYSLSDLSWITKVVVGSFEHFTDLLKNADFNDLLSWFLMDERINMQIINSDDSEEKNSDSCIVCLPWEKRNDRRVAPSSMKSYLKWLLSTVEWIPNTEGIKRNARYCCMDNDHLDPFIIVPAVKYSRIRENVGYSCKKDIDALLSKIGIKDTFQEMDKQVIYETLLMLPSLDEDCKKGKSIYRKLVRDIISPEEYTDNNSSYTRFISDGMVLVKVMGSRKYVPVKEAYYADKKVFSEEILKNFNMLEVDNRSGEEKISKLFGVKPLKYSNIELDGEPILHSLDGEFKKEYARFIPFVLACRLGLKNENRDIRVLKATRIVLCSSVTFRYGFEGGTQVSALGDYETLYIRNANVAYIKVPVGTDEFDELRETFEFCNAVAELVTAFLDVSDGKEFYRDLFGNSMLVREKKMRVDRDDDNLDLLSQARALLNSKVNAMDEFWMTIAELLRIDPKGINEDSHGLTQSILQIVGIDEGSISIDYETLSSPENGAMLVALFKQLGIDVPSFNTLAVHPIDISNYWERCWIDQKRAYRGKYLTYLYEHLKDNKNNADEFNDLCEVYDVGKPIIDNSVNVDILKLYKECYNVSCEELKGYDASITKSVIDANLGCYDPAKKALLGMRCNNAVVEAYALFNRLDDLVAFLSTKEPVSEKLTEQSTTDIVNEILSSDAVGFRKVKTNAQAVPYGHPSNSTSARHKKKTHSDESEIEKQSIGMVGEACVFKELKAIYPSTRWISGNAEEAHCTVKGDDTCGYDITYTDEEGVLQYVEVKASKSNTIVFYLSDSELRFARANSKTYEIIFVHIGENDRPEGKPQRLGHLFDLAEGEDLFDNARFSITSNSYTITATCLEKDCIK